MTRALSQLQDESHANSVAHGFWDEGQQNIPMKLALIHSEISEALEEYRELGAPLMLGEVRYEEDKEGRVKPEGFQIELADAVIRIMDLCGWLSLDLGRAIEEKLAYNRGRPRMHGKAL